MSDGYPSSASDSAMDDFSEADSLSASSHDDYVVRRDRPRGSSVHTSSAMDAVELGRRSLRTPATRSVHYSEISPSHPHLYTTPRPRSGRPASALLAARRVTSTARPGTAASTTAAAALASVVPSGGDRLKHLQLHMEQLQQLYAQEIHKEELAQREGFIQSMCTASITLWRYVCSKPRFFTAVKALVTQYLPANDARLYELEESHGQLALVLANGRAVSVHSQSGSDMTGVVGHAVRATNQLSATEWTAIQRDVAQQNETLGKSAASVSPSSSASSSVRSSSTAADGPHASKSRWLDRHVDYVLPSANDHVFVLLPLDRVYRDSGFDPEIDLTIKKRDLFEGSTTKQLLVVVLRDAQQRPIGALEALMTTKKPLQIDFLDAFASMLAAALEARRSICRPTTGGGLCVQIVDESEQNDDLSLDTTSRESEKPHGVALEIAPGTKMVLTGGTTSQTAENDLPLLVAVQKPMAELFSQSQEWQRRAQVQQAMAVAEQEFWSTTIAMITAAGSSEDCSTETNLCSEVRTAVQQLSISLPIAVRISVLFDGETHEQFVASGRSYPETSTPTLSAEGQYAALECAIRTGETFASTPFVTAMPVIVGERKAAVLVLLESVDTDDEECTKMRTIPLVMRAVELVLWTEDYQEERAAACVEANLLQEALQQEQTRVGESDVVGKLSHELTQCKSVEAIIKHVHRLVETQELLTLRLMRVRLFMAEYKTDGDGSDDLVLHSIWTLRDDADSRIVVYDQATMTSPRRGRGPRGGGGIAAFVLASGEPLMFTPHHAAYDPLLRQTLSHDASDRAVYFYAVPLGSLGVLEFSFPSEDQQTAFAATTFAVSIRSTIQSFLTIHEWISTTA